MSHPPVTTTGQLIGLGPTRYRIISSTPGDGANANTITLSFSSPGQAQGQGQGQAGHSEVEEAEPMLIEGLEDEPATRDPLEGTSSHQEEVEKDVKPVLPQIPFSFPGQTFDVKCQKLILNVWDFFKKVKKYPDILEEVTTPQERAAAALHISAATIGKIGKNFKKTGKLETPGTTRKRQKPVVDSVTDREEEVIRGIINEMRSHKFTPTLPAVLAEARARIGFSGGATSFRRILQRMGYSNLSQKNVVKRMEPELTSSVQVVAAAQPHVASVSVPAPTASTVPIGGNTAALKLVKKEGVSMPPSAAQAQGESQVQSAPAASSVPVPNIITIPAGQLLAQLPTTTVSASGLTEVSGSTGTTQATVLTHGVQTTAPTIYIQGPDNTLRPIQFIIQAPAGLN